MPSADLIYLRNLSVAQDLPLTVIHETSAVVVSLALLRKALVAVACAAGFGSRRRESKIVSGVRQRRLDLSA